MNTTNPQSSSQKVHSMPRDPITHITRRIMLPLVAAIALSLTAVGVSTVADPGGRSVEAAGGAHQIRMVFARQEFQYWLNRSPITNITVEGRNQYGNPVTWRWSGMSSDVTTSGWWWSDGWIKISARCANTGTWTSRSVYMSTGWMVPWLNTWTAIIATNC